MLRAGFLGACLATALSVSGPSLAQPAPASPADEDPAVVKAREQFREGVALMAAQDWANALTKFKAVGRVKMNAQVAFNIAECERELGKLVSALGNYRLALGKAQEPNAGLGADKIAEVTPGRIADLEPRIAKLKVIRKESEPPNPQATIELDGSELAQAQLEAAIPVDPGERTLRVLVNGKPAKLQKLRLEQGEAKEVVVEIPAPEVAGPSGPSATPSAGGPSIPGIVLVSFGAASLVAGGVFIGLRQQAIGELDDLCGGDESCPPSAEDTYDRGRLMTGLAEVFVPVGVVSAVVGSVLLATMSGSSKPAAEASPVSFLLTSPDGQGPGFGVAGSF